MKKRLAYSPGRLVAILTFGVFGIINTEMGVVGIIPQIAETFGVRFRRRGGRWASSRLSSPSRPR